MGFSYFLFIFQSSFIASVVADGLVVGVLVGSGVGSLLLSFFWLSEIVLSLDLYISRLLWHLSLVFVIFDIHFENFSVISSVVLAPVSVVAFSR